nr:MAG TPA: hypothetical protein [Caudoviricetes sp.]
MEMKHYNTLEVALVNNQCDHIRIEIYRDNEKILNEING